MRSLLIVEDNEDVCYVFDRTFRYKYNLHIVQNYAEAAAYLENHKPDMVITDYNFPGGNGREVAILARKKGCKRICLHSYVAHEFRDDPVFQKVANKFDFNAIAYFLEDKAKGYL